MAPKIALFFDLIFGGILSSKMLPKSSQKWSKIDKKGVLKTDAVPEWFWGRFFFNFEAPEPAKTSKFVVRVVEIHMSAFSVLFSKSVPKVTNVGSKILSKCSQKRSRKPVPIFVTFWSHFGSKIDPKNVPKSVKKRAPPYPWFPGAPKGPQGPPKRAPRVPQGSPRAPF